MKKYQFSSELVSVVIILLITPVEDQTQGTLAGHESNGAVAGEGANFTVILFQRTCDFITICDTSCVCQIGYEIVEEGLLNINEGPHASTSYDAPSCIVPPTEQLVIRPHIVPFLPTFHGMESENPYAHIKEFEDVCNTFQEGEFQSTDELKLYPFTLKDKAKIWLNSLRPRSIRTWTNLQAEFLKKFFPTHRTNGLKRKISNFSAKENEKSMSVGKIHGSHQCCPHHGFDTWLLGMDEPNKGEVGKMKSQPNAFNAKAGMYTLNEDVDMKAKFAAMTRKLEVLELKRYMKCKLLLKHQCNPTTMLHMEILTTQVGEPSKFSWKPRAPQYQQLAQPSQQTSSLEQAIVNLSKIDNLQYSISRLTNLNTVQEKGRFPSQPHQNPKGIHEVETHEGESSQVRDVKALITLRSG
ncbi:hypothetical protein CK203_105693 [Vitis vinifera]|uniref:Retrotransposon gag domain-containing protein n=1 Tax=Vitis vinifera TaxID=29760 RepID=A0A438BPH9_VITVI|nr:hypothetical protein CK203_105693 [Vitis vinifera]